MLYISEAYHFRKQFKMKSVYKKSNWGLSCGYVDDRVFFQIIFNVRGKISENLLAIIQELKF